MNNSNKTTKLYIQSALFFILCSHVLRVCSFFPYHAHYNFAVGIRGRRRGRSSPSQCPSFHTLSIVLCPFSFSFPGVPIRLCMCVLVCECVCVCVGGGGGGGVCVCVCLYLYRIYSSFSFVMLTASTSSFQCINISIPRLFFSSFHLVRAVYSVNCLSRTQIIAVS